MRMENGKKMTNLSVYGPFEIDYALRRKVKRIGDAHTKQFWSDPKVSHLKNKQGCYVFALRNGRGFTPWYIGKTNNGFAKEALTDHKLKHINKVLFENIRGRPVLFFVAPPGRKHVVRKDIVNQVEKELIHYAVDKNPKLGNKQHTKNRPQWTIKGVIRSTRGKPPKASTILKTMMNI